LHILHTNCYLI